MSHSLECIRPNCRESRVSRRPWQCFSSPAVSLSIIGQPGHHFWQDQLSITDTDVFPELTTSKAVTDIYLLALAVKHGGRLVKPSPPY